MTGRCLAASPRAAVDDRNKCGSGAVYELDALDLGDGDGDGLDLSDRLDLRTS